MKDDTLYLVHVEECIRRILDYVAGGRDEFMRSSLIQDAVLRNLQTLAESTQRLSDATKAGRPGMDWRRLSGFRNVLVHQYLGVDLERVWEIVQVELPVLQNAIRDLLSRRPDRTPDSLG